MPLLGQNPYPTKEEILSRDIKFKRETVKTVLEFKKAWNATKEKSDSLKFELLASLVLGLAKIYEKPVLIERGNCCCYSPTEQKIYIDTKLSIISTLHEFAHHIYGRKELQACRWSVQLFRKTFPKAYEKLTWNGHMLVRN